MWSGLKRQKCSLLHLKSEDIRDAREGPWGNAWHNMDGSPFHDPDVCSALQRQPSKLQATVREPDLDIRPLPPVQPATGDLRRSQQRAEDFLYLCVGEKLNIEEAGEAPRDLGVRRGLVAMQEALDLTESCARRQHVNT